MTYKQANVSKKCKEAYKKRKTSPKKMSPRRRKTSPRKKRRKRMNNYDDDDKEKTRERRRQIIEDTYRDFDNSETSETMKNEKRSFNEKMDVVKQELKRRGLTEYEADYATGRRNPRPSRRRR